MIGDGGPGPVWGVPNLRYALYHYPDWYDEDVNDNDLVFKRTQLDVSLDGCGYRNLLQLNGKHKGIIWHEYYGYRGRTEQDPYTHPNNESEKLEFFDWHIIWLNDIINKLW